MARRMDAAADLDLDPDLDSDLNPGLNPGLDEAARVAQRRRQFVSAIKIGAPTIAVALLVGLFVWPELYSRKDGFTMSFVDYAVEDQAVKMISPRFLGTDSEARRFVITADAATQNRDDPDDISLDVLQADITLESGEWLSLNASTGRFHRTRKSLQLAGLINVFSDSGNELQTSEIAIDLDAGTAQGDQPVSGQGSFGYLTAERFRATDFGRNIFFEGGVRVTLRPNTAADTAAPNGAEQRGTSQQ